MQEAPSTEIKQRTQGRGPRLYHKKSRTGCHRCKARRVKCDELHPVCSNCKRHGVECIYPAASDTPSRSRAELTPDTSVNGNVTEAKSRSDGSMDIDEDNEFHLPESRSRRLLELQLLSNFINHTTATLANGHFSTVRDTWGEYVPKLFPTWNSLQFAVFSVSALHLMRTEPTDEALKEAHRDYTSLALREHRKAVSVLDQSTIEPVGFTSILILVNLFAGLQERVIEPYTPPLSWLYIANGTQNVFKTAWKSILNNSSSKIMAIIGVAPFWKEKDVVFREHNRAGFEELLQNSPPFDEPCDEESWSAYEKAISFIGSVHTAIKEEEPKLTICSRLLTFGIMAPERFINTVQAERPRALVMLAHLFALCHSMRDVWWIGNVGKREVLGIQKILPPQWQKLVEGPVSMVESDV